MIWFLGAIGKGLLVLTFLAAATFGPIFYFGPGAVIAEVVLLVAFMLGAVIDERQRRTAATNARADG
jgi:hypothetical protein